MSTPAYFLQSILVSPVTLVFGPVAGLNIAIILGPVVSALSAAIVYHKITHSDLSLISGFVFGFSRLLLQASTRGHLHVTWLFGIPLVFYIFWLIYTESIGHFKAGIWLGLVLTLQFYAGVEMLVISLFWIAALGFMAIVFNFRNTVSKLPNIVKTLILSGAISLFLCSYPLYWFFYGSQHTIAAMPNNGEEDVASLFFPYRYGFQPFTSHFRAVSISFIAVAVVVIGINRIFKTSMGRYGFCVAVLSVIAAMGKNINLTPFIRISPNFVNYLLQKVPLISVAYFRRFIYISTFFFGLCIIYCLKTFSKKFKVMVSVLIVLNSLWLGTPNFGNQVVLNTNPVLSTNYIHFGSLVWVYPQPSILNGNPLTYDAQSNYEYRLIGGYGFIPYHNKASFYEPPSPLGVYVLFQQVTHFKNSPTKQQIQIVVNYVKSSKITYLVIYDLNEHRQLYELLTLIFGTAKVVGNNAVWYFPQYKNYH
jgi:hypothetical protein